MASCEQRPERRESIWGRRELSNNKQFCNIVATPMF
jgi:hypothetical protein